MLGHQTHSQALISARPHPTANFIDYADADDNPPNRPSVIGSG
jgi:hypothetical protein